MKCIQLLFDAGNKLPIWSTRFRRMMFSGSRIGMDGPLSPLGDRSAEKGPTNGRLGDKGAFCYSAAWMNVLSLLISSGLTFPLNWESVVCRDPSVRNVTNSQGSDFCTASMSIRPAPCSIAFVSHSSELWPLLPKTSTVKVTGIVISVFHIPSHPNSLRICSLSSSLGLETFID